MCLYRPSSPGIDDCRHLVCVEGGDEFFCRPFHDLEPGRLVDVSGHRHTLGWYGHYKNMNGKPLFLIILLSWGIAFFEYVLQAPANRIGIHYFNLGQLKVIQEFITMIIFTTCAFFYMRQPLKLDYLWAGFCLVGAAYFMFRGNLGAA